MISKFNLKNENGLSIIEVLIATGIMAILMAGFSSMMLNQNKETRAVAEILSTKTFNANQVVANISKRNNYFDI